MIGFQIRERTRKVDAGGDLSNALISEPMVGYAIHRKLGGMVIHGAIRDTAVLRAAALPVYAAGVTHRGPYKDGPREINVPVAIAGMVVHPGDLIVGDDDGVLCIPFADVGAVYVEVCRKMQEEARTIANIESGRQDTSWDDARLRGLGCAVP